MSLKTSEIRIVSAEPPTVPPAVTGWLLCLCLLLTFVYPARTLYHILAHTLPALVTGHGFKLIFLLSVYSIVFISLAVLSFIAGLKLWLVKPGAVGFARLWLWTYLIVNFAYFLLWLGFARHPNSLSLAQMGWYHVVGPIPSFALWYFYLEHSKRVHATYLSR